MVEENKRAEQGGEAARDAKEKTAPAPLPPSFFLELLRPPLCKISGECDCCGRCEH